MNPDSESWYSKFSQLLLFAIVLIGCHAKEVKQSVITEEIKLPAVTVTPDSTAQKNTIYLTFDDGPNRGTEHVLDVVNKVQVPITMFLIGQQVYGSIWQKALLDSIRSNRLIEMANHSYTHAHNRFQKFYNTPLNTVFDFKRCADSLQLSANIIRTPGRNIWRLNNINSTDEKRCIAAADSLRQYGFNLVGWDLEWHFDNRLHLEKTSDQLVSQVDTLFAKNQLKIPGHLVLLMHDQVFTDSADASILNDFVTKLKSSGNYNFAVISKYPGLRN